MDAPTEKTPDVTEDEFYSSWTLFIVCVLMILALWTSYYLQIKKIRAVHETLISIFAGMFVGLVVRLAPGTLIREMLNFKHTLFFNLLLPPIILNSGYELRQDNFFRNFGSILIFAFVGTFISAIGVGILVYVYSFLGLESLNFEILECLIFGSTLSATDPVTILAIFNQLKVDPKLYSIIFGESLLNDAVSIVMYETLMGFHDHASEFYISHFFKGIGIFLFTFGVSTALGIVFGLFMSLTLKHSSLALYPQIETCLVMLVAYMSYFLSNGLEMSGIVSLLFCGITLKHYAYHTMSRRTQRATRYIFATLAQFSENFIFIYLGLSLFTSAPSDEKVGSYFKPIFITITTVCVIFSRYAAVFPLSEMINFFHRKVRKQRYDEIPHSYQMMLFWAGLRGAVGVALASGFHGPNSHVMRMTVLLVVLLTVVMFGGTTSRMLEVLGIRIGIETDVGTSDSEAEGGASPTIGRSSRFWDSRLRSTGEQIRVEAEVESEYNDYHYNHHYRQKSGDIAAEGDGGGRFSTRTGMGRGKVGSGQATPANAGNSPREIFPYPPYHQTVFGAPNDPGDGYESDAGEVLPMAPTTHHLSNPPSPALESGDERPQASHGMTNSDFEDGKWFQALDERYLLPLFSNATASRTHAARKARRVASGVTAGNADSARESEDENSGHGPEGATVVAGGDVAVPGGDILHSLNLSRSMSDLIGHLKKGMGGGGGNGSTSPDRGRDDRTSTVAGGVSLSPPIAQTFHDFSRQDRGLGSPVLRNGGGSNRDWH